MVLRGHIVCYHTRMDDLNKVALAQVQYRMSRRHRVTVHAILVGDPAHT